MHLFVYLSAYLSICLSICPSVYPSVYVSSSMCPSLAFSGSPSLCVSLSLSLLFSCLLSLSLPLSRCLSVSLPLSLALADGGTVPGLLPLGTSNTWGLVSTGSQASLCISTVLSYTNAVFLHISFKGPVLPGDSYVGPLLVVYLNAL